MGEVPTADSMVCAMFVHVPSLYPIWISLDCSPFARYYLQDREPSSPRCISPVQEEGLIPEQMMSWTYFIHQDPVMRMPVGQPL